MLSKLSGLGFLKLFDEQISRGLIYEEFFRQAQF